MKTLAIIVALFMTFSTFALSAHAMGGMGGGMPGGMGGSGITGAFGSAIFKLLQKWQHGNQDITPPGLDGKNMEDLTRQHDEDSAYLKYQIRMRERDLDAVLNSADPDIEAIRALRKDIRELRATADQEQRNYERHAGRMNPGYGPGRNDGGNSYAPAGGRGSGGMGYGSGMMGRGQAR